MDLFMNNWLGAWPLLIHINQFTDASHLLDKQQTIENQPHPYMGPQSHCYCSYSKRWIMNYVWYLTDPKWWGWEHTAVQFPNAQVWYFRMADDGQKIVTGEDNKRQCIPAMVGIFLPVGIESKTSVLKPLESWNQLVPLNSLGFPPLHNNWSQFSWYSHSHRFRQFTSGAMHSAIMEQKASMKEPTPRKARFPTKNADIGRFYCMSLTSSNCGHSPNDIPSLPICLCTFGAEPLSRCHNLVWYGLGPRSGCSFPKKNVRPMVHGFQTLFKVEHGQRDHWLCHSTESSSCFSPWDKQASSGLPPTTTWFTTGSSLTV